MKDNMCEIEYNCNDDDFDCVYRKEGESLECKFWYNYKCTSAIANTNRLVIELERITGMKLKENLTV